MSLGNLPSEMSGYLPQTIIQVHQFGPQINTN